MDRSAGGRSTKVRTLHGLTNIHRNQQQQQHDNHQTVDSSRRYDVLQAVLSKSPRSVSGSVERDHAVAASRPPPLPHARALLSQLPTSLPSSSSQGPPRAVIGLPGMIPAPHECNSSNECSHFAAQSRIVATTKDPEVFIVKTRAEKDAVVPPTSGSTIRTPWALNTGGGGGSEDKSASRGSRNRAAAEFPTLPQPPPGHYRHECMKNNLTFSLLQPAPNTGMYCAPSEMFDDRARGLGRTLFLQSQKLMVLAAREITAERKRNAEASVMAAREASDARAQRLVEGRIRSKTQQYEGYTTRLSKYKFTK